MIACCSASTFYYRSDIGSSIPIKIFNGELRHNCSLIGPSYMGRAVSHRGSLFKADRNDRREHQQQQRSHGAYLRDASPKHVIIIASPDSPFHQETQLQRARFETSAPHSASPPSKTSLSLTHLAAHVRVRHLFL